MAFHEKLNEVKENLKKQQIDGWLLYDFCGSNSLACTFLEISSSAHLTRRFFYWIPIEGTPVKIVHRVEGHILDHLPGKLVAYSSWEELEKALADLLNQPNTIAMEYSPNAGIPTVSKVDGGTLELVRSHGVEVVSSADLLQKYTSVWTERQLQSHRAATKVLETTAEKVLQKIAENLDVERPLTEYGVQQWILEEFAKQGCETNDPPICAVNAHAANPHYSPTLKHSSTIKPGDFILIDLWCKQSIPFGVYGDITRVAVAGKEPTQKQQEVFTVVKEARDAATQFIEVRLKEKQPLMGYEVDKVCRNVIEDAGYGRQFTHRTGHNLGLIVHGPGANIDNFETKDTRQLLPGTGFTIEPGIYLPGEFGIRLEYDVYIHHDLHVEINGGVQEEIICLNP